MRSKINSQKAEVSEKYIKLIKSLQEDKVKINEEKISRFGSIDIDDHGYIDFPDFRFTPECCEDGLVHGCALIGRNFRILTKTVHWQAAGLVICSGTFRLALQRKTDLPNWMKLLKNIESANRDLPV